MVFLPIYVRLYRFPQWVKRHSAMLCRLSDTMTLAEMLFATKYFSISSGYMSVRWFLSIALALLLSCAAVAALMIVILRYLPIQAWFKASAVMALYGISLPLLYKLIRVIHRATLALRRRHPIRSAIS